MRMPRPQGIVTGSEQYFAVAADDKKKNGRCFVWQTEGVTLLLLNQDLWGAAGGEGAIRKWRTHTK